MSADYIQLVGTDVPDSYGSCCFSGQVQTEELRCPSEPMTLAAGSLSSILRTTTENGGENGQLLFFNCPEGTQRFSSEANMRLVRARGFFFTRWTASTVMGMPGLLFTINDAGVRHANFFGPSSYFHTLQTENVSHSRCLLPIGRNTNLTGLEGMLDAMRRHYFWYRPMSFQQLCGGTVSRKMATPLSWNYVCEVPLPLPEKEEEGTTREQRPGMSLLSSRSFSPFFVLALLLSPTSALLGFRVSRSADLSSCEETYAYAIVHAPKASFDPERAKALGVPPGPIYGQLKQGTGVWIDDGNVSFGDSAICGARRFIHPRSVKQATVGSQSMYISLVLDGDSYKDVAVAMELLFGRDMNTSESQEQNERQSTITVGACENKDCRGELQKFLARWQPSLLWCDNQHDASDAIAETEQVERKIVLVHVVHVQPLSFFSEFMMAEAVVAQANYVSSVFTHVRPDVREQVVRCFHNINNDTGDDNVVAVRMTVGVTHHFCAALQQKFSAFPTALTHRYHLNYIATAQFPMSLLPTELEKEGMGGVCKSSGSSDDKGNEKRKALWPYSVKHQLVPADANSPILDVARNLTSVHAVISTSSLPFLPLVSSSKLKKKRENNNGKGQDGLGLLWYPTADSAVAMLSAQFRSTVANVHGHMPRSECVDSLSSQHQDYHHYQDGIHGNDNVNINHSWKLDNGGALTFLGTGSAVPSKYRNVSGTLLEVMYHGGHSSVLCRAVIVLDFGEGNAGQLALLWGNDYSTAMRRFFDDLAFVFISHAHADHHLGLLSLLELRHRLRQREGHELSNALRDPLLVVCPQEVHEFLQETWGCCTAYSHWLQEEVIFDVIPAERYRVGESPAAPVFLPRLDALCRRLNDNTAVVTNTRSNRVPPMMWGAEVFPVHHPANAHALLLRFPAPIGAEFVSRVFLFSGDTRPSPFLIERCRKFTKWGPEEQETSGGVFLCLHEATFGEGCEEEAVQKCHSTLPEALQVAAAIRAEHIVLNHFSQRYPKLPGLMKSQLGGKDVDLRCRRRKPHVLETGGDMKESSTVNSAVDLPKGDNTSGVTSPPVPLVLLSSSLLPSEHLPQTTGLEGSTEVGARKMCFGFDFMRLSFASLESQQAAKLTPLFVRLLEEYESWGVGTTKRLRE